MRREHDVLVVGAGPAGAHLAIRLARMGWSVALLDEKRFPRPKPCGEFLGPDCLPLLEELGLRASVAAAGARPIRAMHLFGHGRATRGTFGRIGAAELAFDHGYAIRRELLDELAVRAAERESGVRLLEGWSAAEVTRDAGGRVTGILARDPAGERHALRAPLTVGADGLRSRVARSLGVWERIPWLDRFALTARAPRGDLSEHSEVHFVPGGYLALSPVSEEELTINLVVARASLPRGRHALHGFFAAALARAPELRERVRLAPDAPIAACGPLAARTRAQVFDGALLVGDACGYVDPITGEGTFFAMRGAALAAETLDAALRAGQSDRAALCAYAHARSRELGHRRALALLLQRGLRHPRLVDGVLALLAFRPRLTDLLIGITGAAVPPRELLRPAVWLELLRSPARGRAGAADRGSERAGRPVGAVD